MAKDKTTIRFWLRTDRPNADGSAPIHLIYQIQGQRKYYAIPGAKLISANWDAVNQMAVFSEKKAAKKRFPDIDTELLLSSADVAEVNSKLLTARKDIADIETRFRLDKTTFSPAMVIEAMKANKKPETKRDEPGLNVVDFIHKFAKDSAGTHKAGTLKVYTGLAAHLAAFEKKRGYRVTFENINVAELRAFHSYLCESKTEINEDGKVVERSMNNITAAKQISTLKSILNYARTLYQYKVNQDYRDYKISRKDSDLEVITVTDDEFNEIWNLDLSNNKRLDAVRDVFCFACATGLRYSDLQQLRSDHIRKDNTIRMTASKTGQKLVIPLNPYSFAILQKYHGKLKPLPVISNQKTNEYIKEIGELAGVDTPIEKVRVHGVRKVTHMYKKYELLSIHVGRKSFITLSLQKGIAIQDVMSLSGHTTFKAFKRYVDVNDKQKKDVMAAAWGSINPLKVAK